MSDLSYGVKRVSFVLIAVVAGLLGGADLLISQVQAQQGSSGISSSVTTENEGVSLQAAHNYNSDAERANDALLITEVKSAIADDGVADGSPLIVDCDHGKILLSGVMKSAQDAKHAGRIAAGEPGVIAVKNQLTWQ